MSGNTTELGGLRVAEHKRWYDSTWTELRPASPADLVAAVSTLPEAEIVETDGYGTFARHFDEGRYLVVPLRRHEEAGVSTPEGDER